MSPRPLALLGLYLDTALAYQRTYIGRPTDDPFTLLMRDANEHEIAELSAELAERYRTGRHDPT